MLKNEQRTTDVDRQLQRIETLHQQLKAEAVRAQDFLAKLRQSQAEPHSARAPRQLDDSTATKAKCGCTCSHNTGQTKEVHLAGKSAASTARVDEREVRDLEKRVRGLEQRVRGFEGLPPDRELALLEVEKLRKELEGLARRREGLFEGLEMSPGLSFGLNAAAAKLEEVLGADLCSSKTRPKPAKSRDR